MIRKQGFKETEIGRIPIEWDVEELKSIIDIKHGFAFKGEFFTDKPNENVVLTPGNIHVGGGFKAHKFKYYLGEYPDEYILHGMDIIVTMTDLSKEGDTLGYSAKIPNTHNKKYLHNQRLGLLQFKSHDVFPDFIYWLLRTRKYQHFVVSSATGSTVKHTSPKRICEYEFPLPPILEQRTIVSILGSLDDKIELNRQMNATLEQIGQAIFKHWFVDFEFPNEDGKPYRSSGGEMLDSELGEVPEGWRVGTLGDICEITMGQSPPGKTYNEIGDGTPFYQGNRDFGFRFPTRRVYCTAPTRFAEDGDALLSVRAPVGSLNVAEERCAIGRGVAALRLRGKQHGYLYYLLIATQSGWNTFEAEGTVFGSANKSDVHGFKVVIPPNELQEQFSSLVESSDAQIITNEKQSRTLSSIRDTLLPKLMSGEIRVKGAEKFIEKTI